MNPCPCGEAGRPGRLPVPRRRRSPATTGGSRARCSTGSTCGSTCCAPRSSELLGGDPGERPRRGRRAGGGGAGPGRAARRAGQRRPPGHASSTAGRRSHRDAHDLLADALRHGPAQRPRPGPGPAGRPHPGRPGGRDGPLTTGHVGTALAAARRRAPRRRGGRVSADRRAGGPRPSREPSGPAWWPWRRSTASVRHPARLPAETGGGGGVGRAPVRRWRPRWRRWPRRRRPGTRATAREAGTAADPLASRSRRPGSTPTAVLARHEAAGQQVLVHGRPGYPPRLADDPAPPAVLFVRGSLDVLAGPTVAIVGHPQRHPPRVRDGGAGWRPSWPAAGCRWCPGSPSASTAPPTAARGRQRRRARTERRCRGRADRGGGHRPRARLPAPPPAAPPPGGGRRASSSARSPLGGAPLRWRFPARNRIIAGLADAVVVVESRSAGGSMLTAAEALARDVPVLAVPGPPHRGRRRPAPLDLISDGAAPSATSRTSSSPSAWAAASETARAATRSDGAGGAGPSARRRRPPCSTPSGPTPRTPRRAGARHRRSTSTRSSAALVELERPGAGRPIGCLVRADRTLARRPAAEGSPVDERAA